MWTRTVSREKFLDVVARVERGEPIDELPNPGFPSEPKDSEICLVWLRQESAWSELPNLLILPDDQLDDFLVFAITYFNSLKPLSSLVRILRYRVFCETSATEMLVNPTFINVLVGVTIAEAMSEIRSRKSFENLPFNTFTGTFSYSISRTLVLFRAQFMFEESISSLIRLRSTTNQPQRRLDVSRLASVWTLLRNLFLADAMNGLSRQETLMVTSLLAVRNGGIVEEKVLSALLKEEVDPQFFEIKKLPREDRVKHIQLALPEIANKEQKSIADDFVCGYLVSLLSDGSLEHAELLFPLLPSVPTALIWYAVFAGLSPFPRLDAWKPGLQSRLKRELRRNFTLEDAPTSDVSMDEFEILLRTRSRAFNLMQANSRMLNLEILPGVDQLINWPPKEIEQQKPIPEVLVKAGALKEIELLLRQCRQVLNLLSPVDIAEKGDGSVEIREPGFESSTGNAKGEKQLPKSKPKSERQSSASRPGKGLGARRKPGRKKTK